MSAPPGRRGPGGAAAAARCCATLVLAAALCAAAPPTAPRATPAATTATTPPTTSATTPPVPGRTGWRALEPGLDLGVFDADRPSTLGDSLIRVLRIDPGRFTLRLLSASALEGITRMSARDWSRRHGLVAAINASMYQTDGRTSVSLMRTRGHVNNAHLSKDKAVLAFDALDASLPVVQIIDRECQDFPALRDRYATLVQSIRMVACDRRNVWAPQERAWSTAAIGMDRAGRVLFIHVRSPYSTHDLIAMLLALPIDLRNAMYVEGGSEAQLYVAGGGEEHEFIGIAEALGDSPARARPVPNVVGVVRRSEVLRDAPRQ